MNDLQEQINKTRAILTALEDQLNIQVRKANEFTTFVLELNNLCLDYDVIIQVNDIGEIVVSKSSNDNYSDYQLDHVKNASNDYYRIL